MKAETYSQIKTLVPISVDGINFPKDTLGAVVESYSNPEGYAVDLAIPDSQLVGGFRYYNVILTPEQFAVMENTHQDEVQALSRIFDILEVYCQLTLIKDKSFNIYRKSPKELFFSNRQRIKGLIAYLILFILGVFGSIFINSLFKIFQSNFVAVIAFAIFAVLFLPFYWGYLELFLDWFNGKTLPENLRVRFVKIKEENRCSITLSNDKSRIFKEHLYDFLRFSSQNDLQEYCIQELQKIKYKHSKVYTYFENKKEKTDNRQKHLTLFAPYLVVAILILIWWSGGEKVLNYIVRVDLFITILGTSSLVLFILPLILLAFSVDTLPVKIYKKCLSILKEVMNNK